jgi:hypothetical protein
MGSDFQYSNAIKWFKNLDILIKYVNAQVNVNAGIITTVSLILFSKQMEVMLIYFIPHRPVIYMH